MKTYTRGEVPEWSNGPVSKTGVAVMVTGGSNPPLSATSLPVRHVLRGANGCQIALYGSEIGVLRRMSVRR